MLGRFACFFFSKVVLRKHPCACVVSLAVTVNLDKPSGCIASTRRRERERDREGEGERERENRRRREDGVIKRGREGEKRKEKDMPTHIEVSAPMASSQELE